MTSVVTSKVCKDARRWILPGWAWGCRNCIVLNKQTLMVLGTDLNFCIDHVLEKVQGKFHGHKLP